MDSNNDGISNGQHLGDPCCRWQPSLDAFSLRGGREYRRWHLSHPSERTDWNHSIRVQDDLRLQDRPENCSDPYDEGRYREDFTSFYFRNAAAPEDGPRSLEQFVKLVGVVAMLAILAYWAIWKHLLADLFPWASSSRPLPFGLRVIIILASFLYMDMTSGIIHLVLDYAPFHLPGIGILARGFQYHHHDPTAIIRISWFAYVSHIHLLCPVIQVAVVLSGASRAQRLFWFWGGVWAHLFQTAHRWAHMPPEWLPFVVRFMQGHGLLLSHERHMSHHEDLEHQFTILSGHTDVIMDSACGLVPPVRYDIWFLIGVLWFLLPMFVDVAYQDAMHRPGSHERLQWVSRESAGRCRISLASGPHEKV
jgi:hypothetical protein